MITHLLTRIDLMMNSLSKGQKRIALFIEEHYDKAAFMTASKLGETVGVSESTVVRFATELGYDGYPKLQKAMQEMIRNKLTSVQRIEVTSNRIGNDNVLDSVLNQDIDKIRRTIEETSHEDFARAVDEICKAERIYILGVRSTAAIANFLAYYFEMIFDNVRVITSGSQTETFEQIFRITDKDVMIGISFPRYSSMSVEAMDLESLSSTPGVGKQMKALSQIFDIIYFYGILAHIFSLNIKNKLILLFSEADYAHNGDHNAESHCI